MYLRFINISLSVDNANFINFILMILLVILFYFEKLIFPRKQRITIISIILMLQDNGKNEITSSFLCFEEGSFSILFLLIDKTTYLSHQVLLIKKVKLSH